MCLEIGLMGVGRDPAFPSRIRLVTWPGILISFEVEVQRSRAVKGTPTIRHIGLDDPCYGLRQRRPHSKVPILMIPFFVLKRTLLIKCTLASILPSLVGACSSWSCDRNGPLNGHHLDHHRPAHGDPASSPRTYRSLAGLPVSTPPKAR